VRSAWRCASPTLAGVSPPTIPGMKQGVTGLCSTSSRLGLPDRLDIGRAGTHQLELGRTVDGIQNLARDAVINFVESGPPVLGLANLLGPIRIIQSCGPKWLAVSYAEVLVPPYYRRAPAVAFSAYRLRWRRIESEYPRRRHATPEQLAVKHLPANCLSVRIGNRERNEQSCGH